MCKVNCIKWGKGACEKFILLTKQIEIKCGRGKHRVTYITTVSKYMSRKGLGDIQKKQINNNIKSYKRKENLKLHGCQHPEVTRHIQEELMCRTNIYHTHLSCISENVIQHSATSKNYITIFQLFPYYNESYLIFKSRFYSVEGSRFTQCEILQIKTHCLCEYVAKITFTFRFEQVKTFLLWVDSTELLFTERSYSSANYFSSIRNGRMRVIYYIAHASRDVRTGGTKEVLVSPLSM